jgi:poly(3-hydroxybutyrate) depolymerase
LPARAGATCLIHLSPQGLDNAEGDGAGWWNTDGQDLAFVDALMAWIEGNFCVDETRLFSVGFSAGGMFLALARLRARRKFRAIAAIAGFLLLVLRPSTSQPTVRTQCPCWAFMGPRMIACASEDGEAAS